MELLVKVFLAVFALQLAPPVLCNEFKFGDLIAIEFPSEGNPPLPIYIHWALYIGKGQVEGLKDVKSDDEDIFHVYGGELSMTPECAFDTLSKLSDKPVVLNYLDKDRNGKEHTPLNKKDMIKEILELKKKCLWWDPITNDCEHVLAYVRYGKKQLGECNTEEQKED